MTRTNEPMRMSLFIAFAALIIAGSGHALNHPAEVVVRVIEETGDVITNARVMISFNQHSQGGVSISKEGITDTNGLYSAKENTSGYIFVRVDKEGYYESLRRLTWHHQQQQDGSFPSSGVTNDVLLRRKINPVALLAKKVITQIPKPGQEFGYDFQAGDWVAPLGQGMVSDVFFAIEGYWKGHRDNSATLTMRFSNTNDGMVYFEAASGESAFCSPYTAPAEGYRQKKIWRKARVPNPKATGHADREIVTIDRNDHANYFFRIRTELTDEGEIESALYGKIYGDIEFGGASEQGGYLKLDGYYLNPVRNDRNVEFDPKRNLFKNLNSDEEVLEP